MKGPWGRLLPTTSIGRRSRSTTQVASWLTNGFSKKVENLAHSVSLHFLHYNFARPHTALKERYLRTPAMAAGVVDHIWSLEEIAALLD